MNQTLLITIALAVPIAVVVFYDALFSLGWLGNLFAPRASKGEAAVITAKAVGLGIAGLAVVGLLAAVVPAVWPERADALLRTIFGTLGLIIFVVIGVSIGRQIRIALSSDGVEHVSWRLRVIELLIGCALFGSVLAAIVYMSLRFR